MNMWLMNLQGSGDMKLWELVSTIKNDSTSISKVVVRANDEKSARSLVAEKFDNNVWRRDI